MSISESFKKNVSSGDVDNVRAALINSLMIDRTFKKFDEELTYAKSDLNGIIETNKGETFANSSAWDINYIGKVSFDLQGNFSNERIKHLKEVLIAVHGKHTSQPAPNQPTSNVTETKIIEVSNEKNDYSGLIVAGIVVVVGVIAFFMLK